MKPSSAGTDIFKYEEAFERNIGWLTDAEQARLKQACVAVAGVGGAGGFQIQALVRMGVGRFRIADPDKYELTNFNRQIGATVKTLGRFKVDVIREMILDVNPEADVKVYYDGVTEANIDEFIEGADLVVDGIDFFEQDAKEFLFRRSREKNRTVLTCCPLGFGASLVIFSPKGIRFEDYFNLNDKMSEKEKRLALAFGLSPSPLCLKYMDRKALNLDGKRAASVAPGLMLVGALTAAETVSIITGKQKVFYAPHVYQIDLITRQVRRKYYPGGMKSLYQQLRRWILFRLTGIHK